MLYVVLMRDKGDFDYEREFWEVETIFVSIRERDSRVNVFVQVRVVCEHRKTLSSSMDSYAVMGKRLKRCHRNTYVKIE